MIEFMPIDPHSAELDAAFLSIWRQALVEKARSVLLDGTTYPVRRTAKHRLAQVDFQFGGEPMRALEQNPQTASRWAQMARKGAKVMQFLSAGKYLAVVADGKITHYGSATGKEKKRATK
jgi:hypothetical protein